MKDKVSYDSPQAMLCPRCNHTWNSRSEYIWITCPSCMGKVRNPLSLKLVADAITDMIDDAKRGA